VKARSPWLTYSVLRLLLFAVPLGIMLALQVYWWVAVPAAALIALPLSYIFLTRPRHAVALELNQIRGRSRLAPAYDDDIEDAQVDEASGSTT
jgi:hypothetical protein